MMPVFTAWMQVFLKFSSSSSFMKSFWYENSTRLWKFIKNWPRSEADLDYVGRMDRHQHPHWRSLEEILPGWMQMIFRWFVIIIKSLRNNVHLNLLDIVLFIFVDLNLLKTHHCEYENQNTEIIQMTWYIVM